MASQPQERRESDSKKQESLESSLPHSPAELTEKPRLAARETKRRQSFFADSSDAHSTAGGFGVDSSSLIHRTCLGLLKFKAPHPEDPFSLQASLVQNGFRLTARVALDERPFAQGDLLVWILILNLEQGLFRFTEDSKFTESSRTAHPLALRSSLPRRSVQLSLLDSQSTTVHPV